MRSGWMWRLQEWGIEREDNCFGGAPGTVDCFGGAAAMIDHLGAASGKLYLGFFWYHPGGVWSWFQYGYHQDWFRVERGEAACTLVPVYVSIRLREISQFRSIERFSTADTVQQIQGVAICRDPSIEIHLYGWLGLISCWSRSIECVIGAEMTFIENVRICTKGVHHFCIKFSLIS